MGIMGVIQGLIMDAYNKDKDEDFYYIWYQIQN